MTRPDPHDLELKQQHHASPGPVDDAEIMCRGGYDPMHYDRGKPKNSIIRAGELLEGSLSVWRGGTGQDDEYAAAVEMISAHIPEKQTLKSIFAPAASAIRDIKIPNFNRVFYVVDDCETGTDLGPHPLHAGVKLSPDLGVKTKEDDLFIQAKAQLLRVFKGAERAPSDESSPLPA